MRLSCLQTRVRVIQPYTRIRGRKCGVRECLSFLRERIYCALAWDQVVCLDNTTVVLIPIHTISRKNLHACRQEMVKNCRGFWSRDEIMYEQETYIYVLQSITNDWDYTFSRWSAVPFCDFWASYMYQSHTHMTRFCQTRESVFVLSETFEKRERRDKIKTRREGLRNEILMKS